MEATDFEAVDSGDLESSRRQHPGIPAYCTELTAKQLRSALQSADRSRAADNRETLIKQFMEAGNTISHDEVVAHNRAVTR